jgi:single-strand DNA-binding protein
MSKDLNLCQFIGRLGKDPEIRHTADGKAVGNFSIACGDDYKRKSGEKVEQTNWINIVVWDRLAEICGEYLKKGSQVYISGKQTTRKWDDKDGNTRYSTEIVASELQMLGGRGDSEPTERQQQSRPVAPSVSGPASGFDDDPEDLPF